MPEPGARTDPYSAFNFLVEIDGLTVAGFSEASGLNDSTEVIEYRLGGELEPRKLPGLRTSSDIVLKRGWTDNRELWEWRKTVIDGHTERRAGAIILLNEAMESAQRFQFREGWPCTWSGPIFDANRSAVAVETLVICHEGLELE